MGHCIWAFLKKKPENMDNGSEDLFSISSVQTSSDYSRNMVSNIIRGSHDNST